MWSSMIYSRFSVHGELSSFITHVWCRVSLHRASSEGTGRLSIPGNQALDGVVQNDKTRSGLGCSSLQTYEPSFLERWLV